MMKNLVLDSKGILFGIIGALIGTIPSVILKNLIDFSNFAEPCFDLFQINIWGDLVITPCGIVSYLGGTFWETFFPIILGGALFGLLSSRIGYKNAQKKRQDLSPESWRGSVWWSFIGGMLFNLLFVYLIFWPGF